MKSAIIAGSFDPVHYGHINMIKRASSLCEKLYIGVLCNEEKDSMFTLEQRVEMLKEATKSFSNIEVISFDGLLANLVHKNNIDCIIRGLRNSKDFEYEINLSQIYSSYPDVPCESLYLMTAPEYSFISSSVVRENFNLGADISNLVPECVIKLMRKYKEG